MPSPYYIEADRDGSNKETVICYYTITFAAWYIISKAFEI